MPVFLMLISMPPLFATSAVAGGVYGFGCEVTPCGCVQVSNDVPVGYCEIGLSTTCPSADVSRTPATPARNADCAAERKVSSPLGFTCTVENVVVVVVPVVGSLNASWLAEPSRSVTVVSVAQSSPLACI